MKFSIRWPIILGTILLIWCAHLITAPYSFVKSEQVMKRTALDIMDNISDLTLEQSHNHLNKARSAAHLAKQLISSEVFLYDEGGKKSLERYFFDQLTIYPHLAGIYLARQNGDFFYVSRNSAKTEGGYRTKIIRHEAGERSTRLLWRDEGYGLMSEELDPTDTYDPRQRPWYKKVMAEKRIVWTAPYVFFTARKPGVTIAGPAFDPRGSLTGIVGVDIEIAELSAFIRRLRVGKSGHAFIINRNRDMIAYHDESRLTVPKDDGKGLRLPKVDEIGDPVIEAAFNAAKWPADEKGGFILNEATSVQFSHGERDYVCMFTPFPDEKLPWVIGVYIPEDDYLGALKHNRKINTSATIAVTILASLLALWLARKIINPIENLRREAKSIEMIDLKTSFETNTCFAEIHETAESFSSVKRSLIDIKDKLAEHERVYRTITNSANDAIIMLDEELEVTLWNPAAQSVFGYLEEEILGRNLAEAIIPERLVRRFSKGVRKYFSGEAVRYEGSTLETLAMNSAGKEFPVEVSVSRLTVDGKRQAAAIVRNITERKRAEELKKRLAADLHDGIGGSLANIKLLAEMVKDKVGDERALKALGSISEVSEGCLAEIRNYMNVLDEESPEWQEMIAELRQYGLRMLEPHGIALGIEANVDDEARPPTTLLYINLFKIFRESITNVIKHAEASRVEIVLEVNSRHVRCTLQDDGKSQQPRLGSGRGLLSMENRAKELGGTLGISYNEGTQVSFSAPLAPNGSTTGGETK